MDFYITVFDDRPRLSTMLKNKYAHQKIVLDSYQDIAGYFPQGSHVYVVIMTLGYRSDELVLRQLLSKNFRYLGMLGSVSKTKMMWKKFAAEKITPAQLKHIHSPIGLDIKSQTPQEIAVSIAAEIIGVKNGI
jgi:xanthine dehydrogenase accessory factor